jgi:hypothetical protein
MHIPLGKYIPIKLYHSDWLMGLSIGMSHYGVHSLLYTGRPDQLMLPYEGPNISGPNPYQVVSFDPFRDIHNII